MVPDCIRHSCAGIFYAMKKNGIETHAVHEFGPVYDADSKILILGSFPSVKSREVQFYYGHPQNRFWKLLALLLQKKEPDGD